jgi:hypothetical protein
MYNRRQIGPGNRGMRRHAMTISLVDFRMPIDRYPGEDGPSNPNNTSNTASSGGADEVDLSRESITVEKPHVHE